MRFGVNPMFMENLMFITMVFQRKVSLTCHLLKQADTESVAETQ